MVKQRSVFAAAVLAACLTVAEAKDANKDKAIWRATYALRISSLDPATRENRTSASIQGNIFEGLYQYHYLKRPPMLIPALAAALPKVSRDQLTWTIKIRPGTNYARHPCFGTDAEGRHKTRAVMAEDFILAIKRIANPHIASTFAWTLIEGRIDGVKAYRREAAAFARGDLGRYHLKISGLRAVDDLTLQIRLSKPWPQLTHVLAVHNFAPVPMEAVRFLHQKARARGRGPAPKQPLMLPGTGPYYIQTISRQGKIVFVRNLEFRDERYPRQGAPGDDKAGLLADAEKRLPFLDEIHLELAFAPKLGWQAFVAGQTSVAHIPPKQFARVIAPDGTLKPEWKKRGIRLVKFDSATVYWLGFNMQDPVLRASKSLRQGLCLAFDAEKYIKVIHNGQGKVATNVIPSTLFPHAQAGRGTYARFDLQAAKKKIEQARREIDAAGLLVGGDIPVLTVEMASREALAKRVGEFCKAQFAQVGVRLKVVLNDWPGLQENMRKGKTRIFSMGWYADYPDAENFLQLYYTPNMASGTNSTHYARPAFDRLFERARILPESPARTRLYIRMIRMLADDCPVLLLNEPRVFVLVRDWVKNFKPHPFVYGVAKYHRIDPPGK